MKQLQTVNVTNADAATEAFFLNRNHIMALQAIWTAGITGSIAVQVSNDGATWEDITGSAVSIAGSSGHQLWNYERCGFTYARLYLTYTSGSGSFVTWANAKGGH